MRQSPVPRGVAIADFDTDGLPDVVVALGDGLSGVVQVLRNTGGGNLNPVPLVSRSAGLDTSAVIVGDFDGNGTPDVAAASEGSNQVFVFLGDGNGGLDSGHITPVGSQPLALVAGSFDAGGTLDLAVACAGDNQVRVLKGNGDGTFTAGPVLGVGSLPVSLAAADLEPDGDLDIVTANGADGTVSILRNDGTGAFVLAASPVVGGTPTGVAVLLLDGNPRPDIATSNLSQSVDLLLDDGLGGFQAATHHTVLMGPRAVVPVDANADGRLDLAVPCKSSDAVAVLIARPPGPPVFSVAMRYAVGLQPVAAAGVDLDGVNGPDLAVANQADSTVSILLNNGSGTFAAFGVPRPVGSGPRAIVAGDFDRDGIQDLAVSSNVADQVSVLRGTGGGSFASAIGFGAGSGPDGLVAADVDADGDLDLLVCNDVPSGVVVLLRNTSVVGSISFVQAGTFAVGPDPKAIFAGLLDNNSTIDFAVTNSTTTTLTVLHGDGTGSFNTPEVLNLTAGDSSPNSVVGADFDGDGDIDLAVTVLNGPALSVFRVSVFRNDGTSFFQPPTRIPTMDLAVHAAAADLNRDGKIDLAIAATGFEALRGQGSVATFEEGEDFVAGLSPLYVVVKDFSGDGHPDVAVVNRDSNDVSILFDTGCTARRLDVAQQPAESTCLTGLGPYNLQAVVEARDDGGNLACPVADVTATIVPGTGTTGAGLTGTVNTPPRVPLSSGAASFTGLTDSLTIDKSGRRYRLQFALLSLPGVPPVLSHSFTLGAQPVILGPASFCPGAQATYAADPAEGGYDEYRWTLDGAASPFAFAQSIVLKEPPTLALGSHTLDLVARVDSCELSALPRTILYQTWQSTSLAPTGPTTVCVDCLGGTVKPTDLGGGAVVSRQWGYRTVAAGAITPIGGETAETYVVKGTDFPGPGNYYLVVTTRFTCPTTPSVSAELPVVVTAQVAAGEVQFLAVRSRGAGASGENHLLWVNSTGTPEKVRIRWNKAPERDVRLRAAARPRRGNGQRRAGHRQPAPGLEGRVPARRLSRSTPPTAMRSSCGRRRSGHRGESSRPGRSTPSGPVKWAYSTGATAVVPPVIGSLRHPRHVERPDGPRDHAGQRRRRLAGAAGCPTRSPVSPTPARRSCPSRRPWSWAPTPSSSSGTTPATCTPSTRAPASPSGGRRSRPTSASRSRARRAASSSSTVECATSCSSGTRRRRGRQRAPRARTWPTGPRPAPPSAPAAPSTVGPAVATTTTQRVYFASRSLSSGPTLWCVQVAARRLSSRRSGPATSGTSTAAPCSATAACTSAPTPGPSTRSTRPRAWTTTRSRREATGR